MRKEEEHLISTASKMYRVRMHRIVINDVERDDDRFPYSIWLGTAAWKKKEKEKKKQASVNNSIQLIKWRRSYNSGGDSILAVVKV